MLFSSVLQPVLIVLSIHLIPSFSYMLNPLSEEFGAAVHYVLKLLLNVSWEPLLEVRSA